MQLFKSLFSKKDDKRAPVVKRVDLSQDGFAVVKNDGTSEKITWADIGSVAAYKVDCITYDNIRLAFECEGQELPLHVSEEAQGFENLMAAMNEALPGINPEWYPNVMLPAFEEKFTVIFRREG